jgi:predicted unusual protein kinase regulating ubiquinone biosynthesis (AarF/ABC1/UbiB family)
MNLERLLDECDYRKEAAYQHAFGERLAGHPTIVVPKVHDDVSTSRVLVTTLEQGRSFYEWLGSSPDAAARDRVTRTFYRFYLGSFYLDGLFNCDPHPGNYLFRDDGKVVFLDYGCCRRFPEERRLAWIAMAKSVRGDNAEEMDRAGRAIGFIPPGVDYDRAAFRTLMRHIYEPYLIDEAYDFALHRPGKTFRTMFVENPNLFRMNMPADAVFLNRITFGLVSLMTEIGSRLNCYRQADFYFAQHDPDWPEDPKLAAAAVNA